MRQVMQPLLTALLCAVVLPIGLFAGVLITAACAIGACVVLLQIMTAPPEAP